MKKTKIDELGRVVIPIDWRRELNLASRDTLELTFDGEKITIKKCDRYVGCAVAQLTMETTCLCAWTVF